MVWKQHLNAPKFRVQCHAGEAGEFQISSNSVNLKIGQRIRNDGREQLWNSVLVDCRQHEDGSQALEIVISHPKWEKPLRIAYAESAPQNASAEEPTLGFDLEQRPV